MSKKSALSRGAVTFTLAGGEVTLRPTPRAMEQISTAAGGLVPAINKLSNLDVGMVATVVNAGLLRSGDAARRTMAEIHETGADSVAAECVRFVTALANGGRERDEAAEEEGVDGDAAGNGAAGA